MTVPPRNGFLVLQFDALYLVAVGYDNLLER